MRHLVTPGRRLQYRNHRVRTLVTRSIGHMGDHHRDLQLPDVLHGHTMRLGVRAV